MLDPLARYGFTPEQRAELYLRCPEPVTVTLAADAPRDRVDIPDDPAAMAAMLDEGYRLPAHLTYLSDRLAQAVKDVEQGKNRMLRISMPPRSGKSVLTSINLPVWLLAKHPDWKLGLISHDPGLAAAWGREVRTLINAHGPSFGVKVARDAGAVGNWQTTAGGGVVARSAPGQSLTGRGFSVLIVDDAVRDFAAAHSETARDAVWEWWTSNAFTRLEPPYFVAVVGTRWHMDDLLGRIGSREYAGRPEDWEVIEFPAIAEGDDVLGRAPGDPLFSPLLTETREQALARWDDIKQAVGRYMFAALYQQRPSPAKGAIVDVSSLHFWTVNPEFVSDKVHLLDPLKLSAATWLDSWDFAFKALDTSDYVVGQRWMRSGPYRHLMYQTRARRTFTETEAEVLRWCDPHLTPYARFVHKRLVEAKANGDAIMDVLKDKVSGIKPITPKESKEARMWAVTPEIESGHVRLPYPGDPGNEWVLDLISELREFNNGTHDDQCDAFSQGLTGLREPGGGTLTLPQRRLSPGSSRVAAARTIRPRRI